MTIKNAFSPHKLSSPRKLLFFLALCSSDTCYNATCCSSILSAFKSIKSESDNRKGSRSQYCNSVHVSFSAASSQTQCYLLVMMITCAFSSLERKRNVVFYCAGQHSPKQCSCAKAVVIIKMNKKATNSGERTSTCIISRRQEHDFADFFLLSVMMMMHSLPCNLPFFMTF